MFEDVRCPVVFGYLSASNDKISLDLNKYKNLNRFSFEESLDRYLFCFDMAFRQCCKIKDVISFDIKENKSITVDMGNDHDYIMSSVLRDISSIVYFGSRRVEKNRKMIKVCEDAGAVLAEIKLKLSLDKTFIKFKDIDEDVLTPAIMSDVSFKISKFLGNFKFLDFEIEDLFV